MTRKELRREIDALQLSLDEQVHKYGDYSNEDHKRWCRLQDELNELNRETAAEDDAERRMDSKRELRDE